MNLVYYPDPILSEKLEPVDISNPGFDPLELKKEMVSVMVKGKGLGLSACQVGLKHRLFVMGENEEASALVINPEVVEESFEEETEYEGCLSFPGVFMKIPRARQIKVEYYDERLEKRTEVIEGYAARCFLHELDHLNGVVYKDRVSRLKWDRAQKRKVKLEKHRASLIKSLNRIKGEVINTPKENEEVLDLTTG